MLQIRTSRTKSFNKESANGRKRTMKRHGQKTDVNGQRLTDNFFLRPASVFSPFASVACPLMSVVRVSCGPSDAGLYLSRALVGVAK
jgi:hypothetical protein